MARRRKASPVAAPSTPARVLSEIERAAADLQRSPLFEDVPVLAIMEMGASLALSTARNRLFDVDLSNVAQLSRRPMSLVVSPYFDQELRALDEARARRHTEVSR